MIFGEAEVSQEEIAIVDRKFKFEGSLTKPCLVVVNTDKVRGGLGIWLTPGLTKATFFVKAHGSTLRLLQTSTVEVSILKGLKRLEQYIPVNWRKQDLLAHGYQCRILSNAQDIWWLKEKGRKEKNYFLLDIWIPFLNPICLLLLSQW
jgi:hypothetical protein